MRQLITVILITFCFLLPINFYVIGNNNGYGFQGAFYNYKFYESNGWLLPVTSDIGYVINGDYTGRTMLSVIFWFIGSIILFSATGLWLTIKPLKSIVCVVSYSLIISGGFYFISIIFQYGPLFNGPAGISIPFGIPFLFIFGYLIFTSSPNLPEPH